MIFDRKMAEKTMTKEEAEENKNWLEKLDGKKVQKIFGDGDGMIGDYFVAKEWMRDESTN